MPEELQKLFNSPITHGVLAGLWSFFLFIDILAGSDWIPVDAAFLLLSAFNLSRCLNDDATH